MSARYLLDSRLLSQVLVLLLNLLLSKEVTPVQGQLAQVQGIDLVDNEVLCRIIAMASIVVVGM